MRAMIAMGAVAWLFAEPVFAAGDTGIGKGAQATTPSGTGTGRGAPQGRHKGKPSTHKGTSSQSKGVGVTSHLPSGPGG